MLQQSYVTTPSFLSAPTVSVVRSAVESRALTAFQSVLIKGTREAYFTHPDFHGGFEWGYECVSDTYEPDEEILLEDVLETLEKNLSFAFVEQGNQKCLFLFNLAPLSYEHHVGFALGFLRYLGDAGCVPVMPHSLLQKWHEIEGLTRRIADRLVGQEG